MARRIRLIKLDKQQKMFWTPPGGMGMFILMCVMMVVLIQMLRQPGFMRFMLPKEPKTAPLPGQASPTEVMEAEEEPARPKPPPKPHVALAPDQERKLLAKVVDQNALEKQPYFYLLAKVNAMSDAQIDAGVDPHITYDTFADNPAAARGRIVKIQGLLKRLKETKITDTIGSGFDSVWEGNIIDNELRVISFVLTQPPPKGWFEPSRDNAIVKGVFLKNIVYRDRGGGFTASPFIIAKGLVKIVPPPAAPSFWSDYKEYIIVVVIVAGVVGFVFFEHRRRVRAALSALPRRKDEDDGESLEIVPDESAEPIQQANPGPAGAEEKKAEEEKKNDGRTFGSQ